MSRGHGTSEQEFRERALVAPQNVKIRESSLTPCLTLWQAQDRGGGENDEGKRGDEGFGKGPRGEGKLHSRLSQSSDETTGREVQVDSIRWDTDRPV